MAAVVIADQVTKIWVTQTIAPDTYNNPPPVTVVGGFFYFVNITNRGAAWGQLAGYSTWLAWLAVVALVGIYFSRRQLELHRPLLQYSFGLLCGGIIGNLLDRGLRPTHDVVDFLDFHFGSYRFPAFNVADSGITVGVTIYLLYSFRDWAPGRAHSHE